ncbi:MAG: hypothetical protein EON61_06490 [Alphaproteobacteria bacterium]|nr:MAG: hypothetical protein EON61_06490 [Alphaproteobacteria bacterium]
MTNIPTSRYPHTNDTSPQTSPPSQSNFSPGRCIALVIIPMPANDRICRSISGGAGGNDTACNGA